MSPRAFERPATIAFTSEREDDDRVLEGLFVPASESTSLGAVIAPPHPLYGGNMDHPVVTELSHACARHEIASLRFNWRGVGASAGEMSGDPRDALADYRASLAFVTDTVDGPFFACGYSFGAATAVAAARGNPLIRRLLLVAPPMSLLDVDALRAFRGRVWIAVGAEDALAGPKELEALAAELERASFVALPETDHFFAHSLPALGRAAVEWLGS
jgi:alpha/beta superfamily hydrolase